jgi:protein-tyrosine-phosphatase
MGAGFMRSLGADRVRVFSGGSEPASKVNPSAVTMGCGDTCPYIPGKRYVDWPLDDPAGQGVESVRPIRDQIKSLVESLLTELGVR